MRNNIVMSERIFADDVWQFAISPPNKRVVKFAGGIKRNLAFPHMFYLLRNSQLRVGYYNPANDEIYFPWLHNIDFKLQVCMPRFPNIQDAITHFWNSPFDNVFPDNIRMTFPMWKKMEEIPDKEFGFKTTIANFILSASQNIYIPWETSSKDKEIQDYWAVHRKSIQKHMNLFSPPLEVPFELTQAIQQLKDRLNAQ